MRTSLLIILLFGALTSKAQEQTVLPYGKPLMAAMDRLKFDWTLPTDQHALMQAALSSMKRGSWRLASSQFTAILVADSTFLPARFFRTICDLRRGARNRDEYVERRLGRFTQAYVLLWDQYTSQDSSYHIYDIPFYESHLPVEGVADYLIQITNIGEEPSGGLRNCFFHILIGEPLRGLDLLNRDLAHRGTSPAIYLKAVAFRLTGEMDSVATSFERLVTIDSNVFEAHQFLAPFYIETNDYPRASKHLAAMARLAQRNFSVMKFVAFQKLRIKDYNGALSELTECLAISPEDKDCLKARAFGYSEIGNYNASNEDISKSLKVYNIDLDLHLLLSDNYIYQGDTVNAIKLLRKAEGVFGFNQVLNFKLAERLAETTKWKEAQAIIDREIRVIKLNNMPASLLRTADFVQAKIHLQRGKADLALVSINALILNDGEKDEYFLLKSRVLRKLGRQSEGQSVLDALIKKGYRPAVIYSKRLGT